MLINSEKTVTIFFLIPLWIIKKIIFWLSTFQILKNANLCIYIPGRVLLHIPFSNIKKAHLRILKYLAQIFCLSPFLNVKKNHTYECQNNWHRFFSYPIFKYWKKYTYKSENNWHSFSAYTLFKYWKKHTYESQITLRSLLLLPFSNIKKSILINS